MVILITGASHTGKTALANRLMKELGYPCFSIDHLKMGLIRSGNTQLTPMSSTDALTNYLWPILREMVKTAIENQQDMILEGCYIPANWRSDFDANYLKNIRYCCLIMHEDYIKKQFSQILSYANIAERRMDDSGCTEEYLLQENELFLHNCQANDLPYILIHEEYQTDVQRGLNVCLTD